MQVVYNHKASWEMSQKPIIIFCLGSTCRLGEKKPLLSPEPRLVSNSELFTVTNYVKLGLCPAQVIIFARALKLIGGVKFTEAVGSLR